MENFRKKSASANRDDNTADEQATTFDAAHFKDIFKYYNLDVTRWAVCQDSDNCRTNKKRMLGIPHVGCNNHKLNSEVEKMVDTTSELAAALTDVHITMLEFKTKLRNRAALRNITGLNPVLYNRTRWNGKLFVLKRFLDLRDHMIQVAASTSDVQTIIRRSPTFRATVEKFVQQLKEIH